MKFVLVIVIDNFQTVRGQPTDEAVTAVREGGLARQRVEARS